MCRQAKSASRPRLGEAAGWAHQTCIHQTWGSLHATGAPAVWLRMAFNNPRKLLVKIPNLCYESADGDAVALHCVVRP